MIPQIEIGKKPQEVFHVDMMVAYPEETPFGNLNLAEMEILTRIDYLNQSLQNLYKDWHLLVPNLNGFVTNDVLWIRYKIEDIIYSMRKILDGLISISYILAEFILSGSFPKKISIDSIGKLLRKLEDDPPKYPESQNDTRNMPIFKGCSLSSLVQSANKLISDIRNDHKRMMSLMKK